MNHSELAFEKEFIDYLTKIGGTKQWVYEPSLKNDDDLWDNFKQILERNNRTKLDGALSKSEFDQVKRIINKIETPYEAGQFLYGVNGVSEIEVDLDNGKHVYLQVFDQAKVGAGETSYQIVNQISRDKVIVGGRNCRFDVTLLINGLPIIQIELKNGLHTVKEALNQMHTYAKERLYTGIFSTLQILIAMTPYDAKYMANVIGDKFNTAFAFNWQREKDSKPVHDWKEFSNLFLSIPMAHDMATRYMILDGKKGKECIKVMRPYQVYATKKVLNKVTKYDFKSVDGRLGYVWHTTGSGKTITSFKTAWLASRLPNVGKVIFLVDRVALTRQTYEDYKAYDPIANISGKTGVIGDTANVLDLKKKLSKKSDKNIIVTSIQKMSRYVSRNDFKKPEENLLFIVDEAHRSTGDGTIKTDTTLGMLENIRKAIPCAGWVGYTGTPKFPETSQIFGEALHIYTIKEAIADHNVLGFKVDFKETIKPPVANSEDDFDDNIKASVYDRSDEHVRLVVEDVLDHWKDRSNNYKFNALFTVHVGGGKASTPRAMQYYETFREEMKNRPESQRLKIAVLFSLDTSNSDRQVENHEKLRQAMLDYHEEFGGTFFGLDEFANYKEDVMTRLKKGHEDGKALDLVIVVDQLLTGFDAPELNTLYVDRTLRGANLIQAYSRTNRMFNMNDKPFGNVINYRWPEQNEKEMNHAFATYSSSASATEEIPLFDEERENKESGIIARPYKEVRDELASLVDEIKELTEEFTDAPSSEKDREALYEKMGKYNRLLGQLKQYTEDGEGHPISAFDNPKEFFASINMTEEDEIRLSTVIYNDLKEWMAKQREVDISEIELEMVLVHDVTINYDYLVELIAKMADEIHQEKPEEATITLSEITAEIAKIESPQERLKIQEFINKVFNKQYVFSEYPVSRDVEKMNQLINENHREGNLAKIRKFIQTWGLDNATNPKEVEKLIIQHRYGQDDLDKQNELSGILMRAKEDYKNLANEEVARLSWVKYRSSLRTAIKELADQIKKGE